MTSRAASMDLFDAMTGMRAMRRLKSEPVPEEVLREVIRLATHAPSGVNAHSIRWVVVRDAAKKRRIADLYAQAWSEYQSTEPSVPSGQTAEIVERTNRAMGWQVAHLHEAPLLIFACMAGARPFLRHRVMGRSVNGQVWVAVENLMLACRAHGLGATITTLHLAFEDEISALLGLPDDAASFAMIPVGYPLGRFGPTRGVPVDTVLRWDSWGGPPDP
ncbi:MAG TPA: nitroreductase family protein [Tepidiformaceae bacterium]|nr:nitroreductase family protein [Tepidiformaceae bacterium]